MKNMIMSVLALSLLAGVASAAKLPPREAPGARAAYTADKLRCSRDSRAHSRLRAGPTA